MSGFNVLNKEFNLEVDSDLIDVTCLELNNIIDNITTNFNSIDMIIFNLEDYFISKNSDELRKKFEGYKNKIELFKDNLNTYVSDLVKVKSGSNDLFSNQSKVINSFSDNVALQTENIDQK